MGRRADELLTESYFEYAGEIIKRRGLPRFEDGLKEGQRRIIYSMWIHGNKRSDRHKKCANIIGHVIGELHPHGDTSSYKALVRLSQNFSTNIPLIDPQGNFGSLDGDPAAAMRYTEARLSWYAHELMMDFNKDITPMSPNYDGTMLEPIFLPSRVPNLALNGAHGIAVGISTSFPPNNLNEVMSALIALNDNPEMTTREIMTYIQGPDFPTGCIISSPESIYEAYSRGEGSIIIRAPYVFENEYIVFTSVPYMTTKSDIMKQIAEGITTNRIEGVSQLRDESTSEVRIVLKVKNGYSKEIIINQVYNVSSLKTSFRICLFALDQECKPKIFNMREYLKYFLKLRYKVILERYLYDLEKYKKRTHILIGFSVALQNLDLIVDGIKKSENIDKAKEFLRQNTWNSSNISEYLKVLGIEIDKNLYTLSEEQIKGILDLKLHNLVQLEKQSIEKELSELHKSIIYANLVINSPEEIRKIMRKEFEDINERYKIPRKTSIENLFVKFNQKDLITPEDIMIILSKDNYIKRVSLANYKIQHKGGKGRIGSMEDVAINVIGNTHSVVLFFANNGIVYSLNGYEIPEGDHYTKGRALINLFETKANMLNFLVINDDMIKRSDQLSIIFVTKDGQVRKNSLSQFISIRMNGKKYMNEEDSKNVISVLIAEEDHKIFIATKSGMGVLTQISQFRTFNSRNSDGVRGCKLKPKDRVINAIIIKTNEDSILTITENGYGKLSPAKDYRLINRGGKGVINIKNTTRNGNVVDIATITNQDEIIVMTTKGITIRFSGEELRLAGRNTAGIRLCKVDHDKVISMSKVSILDN